MGESHSVRTGYTDPILIAFSPDGRRVALEYLPVFEASAMRVRVLDLAAATPPRLLEEHALVGWLDARHLLTYPAQGDLRLTLWDVVSGLAVVGRAAALGGEAYLPACAALARPSADRPNPGRAVDVIALGSGERLARLEVGADVLWVGWTPNGERLLALTATGALITWPLTWEE